MPVDLSKVAQPSVPLVGAAADAAIQQFEVKVGMRCVGCGERVQKGWEFCKVTPIMQGNQPTLQVQSVVACDREECDFAEEAAKVSRARRRVEWEWLIDQTEDEAGQ